MADQSSTAETTCGLRDDWPAGGDANAAVP